MENRAGKDILSVLNGVSFKNTDRNLIGLMLHEIVFDNQRAVYDLVGLHHISSASALLRVIFEAHVKALWVTFCASEKEVLGFKADKIKSRENRKNSMTLQEMINGIESVIPSLNGSLSLFKSKHWKELNSLTHSGTSQFRFRVNGSEMSKYYDELYIEQLLSFSTRFAISSLTYVGKITDNVKICKCSILLAKDELGIAIQQEVF